MKNSHSIFPNIKRRNLIYYALYAGVLIGFAAFILYPDFRKTKQMEAEIASVKKKITEQDAFYEQYKMYRKEIENFDKTNYFNFSVSIGSEKCFVSEIQDNVKSICLRHGFGISVSDVRGVSDRTVLICSLTGDFDKLRGVLIDLGRLYCLERIGEIRIVPAENAGDTESSGKHPEKEIVLTLWMLGTGL